MKVEIKTELNLIGYTCQVRIDGTLENSTNTEFTSRKMTGGARTAGWGVFTYSTLHMRFNAFGRERVFQFAEIPYQATATEYWDAITLRAKMVRDWVESFQPITTELRIEI